MNEQYGAFEDFRPDPDTETLNLSFWPGRIPLKQRWRNNGLSADFLGDYVTTFFPLEVDNPATQQRQSEIRSAVSFVANELLENAMKFHDNQQSAPIDIQLCLYRDRIVFHESNACGADDVDGFRTFVKRVVESDPSELYMEQLEHNAVAEGTAGLGYLTMINDYGAELAWRFESTDNGGVRVTVQVTLPI